MALSMDSATALGYVLEEGFKSNENVPWVLLAEVSEGYISEDVNWGLFSLECYLMLSKKHPEYETTKLLRIKRILEVMVEKDSQCAERGSLQKFFKLLDVNDGSE